MNTNTDDPVRWLGEQLDEDERIARSAEGDSVFDGTGIVTERNRAQGFPDRTAVLISPVATHIARHDPARVLREIDAKRQILRALESAEVSLRNTVPGREPHELMTGSTNSLRAIVRMLATVYADRPGFRAEWRP